ncbi:MAG: MCP four helix bundle domain-containing protein, partial [Dehalococcoidia bacterium]|nr:MCP four helix bundle domain-containing protein [Dehalococcoidia bacterium]
MKLSISAKLIGGFGVVLLLVAVVGWMGISNVGAMSDQMNSMYNDRLIPIQEIDAASNWLHRMRAVVLEFLVAVSQGTMYTARETIADHETELVAQIDLYRKTDLTQGEKDLLAQFDKVYPIYRQERDTVLELKSKGDDADAMLVF